MSSSSTPPILPLIEHAEPTGDTTWEARTRESSLSSYEIKKPFVSRAACSSTLSMVAAVIVSVAGVVLVTLALSGVLGELESIGSIASMSAGGLLFAVGAGAVFFALLKTKGRNSQGLLQRQTPSEASSSSKSNEALPSRLDQILKFENPTEYKKEFSKSCLDLLHSAKESIKSESSQPELHLFSSGFRKKKDTLQPQNKEIAQFYPWLEAAKDTFFGKLELFHNNSPWEQNDVIQAAAKLLGLAYCVSMLTLQDLPACAKVEDMPETEESYAELLSRQDVYLYRAFYQFPYWYHMIAAGIRWYKKGEESDITADGAYTPPEIPPQYEKKFFEAETTEASWRECYNEFCMAFRGWVHPNVIMGRHDERLISWSIPDQRVKGEDGERRIFHPTPDTLPT